MIYFLAEYCLNSLNGTFFSSAEALQESNLEYTKLAPLGSLYIIFIGANTLNVSVVLSQLMFLYHLFHSIDCKFGQLVKNTVIRDTVLSRCIHTFVSYVPIIPLLISLSLHGAYISYSNKCKALFTRILYSLCQQIVVLMLDIAASLAKNAVLREPSISMPLNFCLNYLFVNLFSVFYRASELMASALVLSFGGTYFFLKTYAKSPLLGSVTTHEFSFLKDLASSGVSDMLISYLVFALIFSMSILSQKLINVIIVKSRRKEKIV